MNRQMLFISGLALTTLAAALAVRVTLAPADPSDRAAGASADPQPRSPRMAGSGSARDESPRRSPFATPRETTARTPLNITPPDGADQELIARVAAVQHHADRELQRLTRRLGLSENQRARIFPILAAESASYHPAMNVPGLSHADAARVRNGELGIDDVLTPVQKDERIAAELDDGALWREIFENLKRQLDENTPLPIDEPQTTEPTHGRRNLNEWVDP